MNLKGVLFWLIVVAALVSGTYGYFLLKENRRPTTGMLDLVPAGAVQLIRVGDLHELNSRINKRSLIIDQLAGIHDVKKVCRIISGVDSLISSDELLGEFFDNNQIIIGVFNGPGRWLAALNFKELKEQASVSKSLTKVFKSTELDDGIKTFGLGHQQLFMSIRSGVIIFSGDKELISDFFSDGKKLKNEIDLTHIQEQWDVNKTINLYTSHASVHHNWPQLLLQMSGFCATGVSVANVEIETEQVSATGIFTPGEETGLCRTGDQSVTTAENVLPLMPNGVCGIRVVSFGDLNVTRAGINKSDWKQVNDSALFDMEREFYSNLSDQVISAIVTDGSALSITGVRDTVKAISHLVFLSDTVFPQGTVKLYRLSKFRQIAGSLLTPLVRESGEYCFLYGSHLYVAPTYSFAQLTIANLVAGRTAYNDEELRNYWDEQVPDEFSSLFYIAPSVNEKMLIDAMDLEANTSLKNLRHLSVAFTSRSDNYVFRFNIVHQVPDVAGGEGTLWTHELDAEGIESPVEFVNHLTREKEVIVYDNEHNVYLLNAKGNRAWKKNVGEKIISHVFSVDAFKNNKHQILFSSKNFIHLIDRNGNYVEGFPVKLPAPATAPISVFDYDSNKDYRILVPCADKQIHCFLPDGKRNANFSPVRTKNRVNLPVQFAAVGPYQYIVAIDEAGDISVFGRKGNRRIELKNRTVAGCKDFYLDVSTSNSSSFICYFDEKEGNLHRINFDDKKEITRVHGTGKPVCVRFREVDAKRGGGLLLAGEGKASVYALTGEKLIETSLGGEVHRCDLFRSENLSVLSAVDTATKKLYNFSVRSGRLSYAASTTLPLLTAIFNDDKYYRVRIDGRSVICENFDQ